MHSSAALSLLTRSVALSVGHRGIRTRSGVPLMSTAADALKISDEEKFLFDLNGFLVLRGVLSPEEVAAANAAIDAKQGLLHARDKPALRNTKAGSPLDAASSCVTSATPSEEESRSTARRQALAPAASLPVVLVVRAPCAAASASFATTVMARIVGSAMSRQSARAC